MSDVRGGDARWLPIAAACAAAACTLTSDPYEPSSVDRVDTELGAVDTEDPAPPPVGSAGAGPVGTPGGGEQPIEPGRLEPGEPDEPGGSDDPRAGGEDGQLGGVGDPAPSDAGVPSGEGPPDIPEVPDVPAEPDAAAPSPPIEELCATRTFGGSCYEVFAEFVSWNEAEGRCISWGGHLASVQSPEEDDFLDTWPADLGITTPDGTGVWLGGTDVVSDGNFRWLDGSALTITPWAAGQPDNGVGVDCIEKRNDGAGLWYDLRCTDSQRYICERPL